MTHSISAFVTRALNRWRLGKPVIVVSGLPRSGTSMLMNMLEAGGVDVFVDDRRPADRDNLNGYFEYERVKELESDPDRSWLRQARGRAIKVVSHLLRSLPPENHYLVLLATRDLTEVMVSQNRMLARLNQENPITDEKAIRLGARHLQNIRGLVEVRSNFAMMEVPYAEVIGAADAWSRRIATFVGRELDCSKMARVVDEKLYRNRAASGGQGARPAQGEVTE
jgi:hypothetical protein